MNITVNFLLQATRVLQVDNYDDSELEMVYNFLVKLDNIVLTVYNKTCTIPSYNSDLELYVEIIEELIRVFIEREEYEKCSLLKNKKEEALRIIKLN